MVASCGSLWFAACASYTGAGAADDADAAGGVVSLPDASTVEDGGFVPPAGCELDATGGLPLECVTDAAGVFVRLGAADGDGSKARPFGTFAQATAGLGARRAIFASAGEYAEAVVVDENVSVFGGFSATFDNPPPRTSKTILAPVTGVALEVRAGAASAVFDDLVLRAGLVPTGTQSSVAGFVHSAGNSAATTTFRRVDLFAGTADAGPAKTPTAGSEVCGAPGACSCAEVAGGIGGRFGLAPQGGSPPELGGVPGANGNQNDCIPAATKGGRGADATARGANGPAAESYAVAASGIVAVAGESATRGQGGGGGGGGGGGLSDLGGNGGNGGCGGRGGAAGVPGGHSVALLAWQATVTLADCTLHGANGGIGGVGEPGRKGSAGAPGNAPIGGALCGKAGGDGGEGAEGGDGGAGVGGSSICVLAVAANVAVTPALVCETGTAGAGGAPNNVAGASYSRASLDAAGRLVGTP